MYAEEDQGRMKSMNSKCAVFFLILFHLSNGGGGGGAPSDHWRHLLEEVWEQPIWGSGDTGFPYHRVLFP